MPPDTLSAGDGAREEHNVTLTWTRDGLSYTVTPPPGDEASTLETKAKTGKWDAARAAKNPRDSKGRFIETGAEVRVLNVGLGRVLGQGGAGKTRVQLYKNGKPSEQGETREVDNDYLTVTKRPGGGAPTDKPEDLKPDAAPADKPEAPRVARKPAPPPKTAALDTPDAVRDHWVMGAQFQPGLSDQHREFLRSAGKNASDLQLSDGKNLVLLQLREGGGWRIMNHHGQGIGAEQPDLETARGLANRLETELVDANGTPLDFNSPGFPSRGAAFRTADGETLGVAAQRIFEGGPTPPAPPRTEPWTGEDLRGLAKKYGLTVDSVGSGNGEQIKLKHPRDRTYASSYGLGWSAWSKDGVTTGNGRALLPHEVEPYAALYAANPTENPLSLYDRMKRATPKPPDGSGGDTPPEPDRVEPPKLDTPAKLRAFWESGGEGDPRLTDDERRALRHAALRHPETRLSDDGQLVLARQIKSGPYRILTLYGQPTMSGEVASLTRARDLARRLERDMVNAEGVPLNWNERDRDQWLSFRSDRGEAFEAALERIGREHRAAMDAAGSKRGQQGVTKYGDATAVRAYWANGGREEPPDGVKLGQWESHRGNLRWKAENVEDLKVSPGGQFMLYRVRKGLPWDVSNVEGQAIKGGFTSEKQARDFAARLETEVVDADGNALDFNAPDFATQAKTFRTRGGETVQEAVARIIKGDPKPKPEPKPEVTAKLTAPGKPITSVDQLRSHLAAGGDEFPAPADTRGLATAERLELVAGNSFFIRPIKNAGGVTWGVHHARTGRAAAPKGHEFDHDQARAFAEGLKKLWDQNGNRFDWDGPNVHNRLGQIPDESRNTQITAILAGEDPHKPGGGTETRRFKSIDEVRAHWRKLADDPSVPESHRKYLRSRADDPTLVLSPGGALVINPQDARTVSYSHAFTGLALASSDAGSYIWSEWGGRKAHLELARRLETQLLDADGKPLDWSQPDMRSWIREWRSEYGENALEAAHRVKGQWDHENGKNTLAAGDYSARYENPDRPASREDRAYGDEVKVGDVLTVQSDPANHNSARVGKLVTAVESAGWGRYRFTFEDGTDLVRVRNEVTARRSRNERLVTGRDGEVIGERVPVGVLKPGDRVQYTAELATTFNGADQNTLRDGGFDVRGRQNVRVEGTVTPDRGHSGRMILTGVTVTNGRTTVRLPDRQADRTGNLSSHRLGADVVRLGEPDISDADRDAARKRRLAEAEQERRDQVEADARMRLQRVYYLDPPRAATLDQAELERRRAELADADRDAVDAAAARLHVALSQRPKNDPGQDGALAAHAVAIGERMAALGYLNPASNYRSGWQAAEGNQNRPVSAWQRILSGDRMDDDALRGVADMAAALGKRDVVEAVQAERDRRQRQPDPWTVEGGPLADALEAVDEPAGRALRGLAEALDGDASDVQVRERWNAFDDAIQAALGGDVDGGTYKWLTSVQDEMIARMRQANHRPVDADSRERLARYGGMDDAALLRELDGMRYADDAYDDLAEVLEQRGYTPEGNRPYGSAAGLADPQKPSDALAGQRVAAHDGQGGWMQGFLHKRRGGDWVLSQSADDPGVSPVRLRETGRRGELPSVEPARPGHPALADLELSDYSTQELDGELNRLAPEIQALWKANRRRGDAEFDRRWTRYNTLLQERQGRPDPEPEPLEQDEALFDTSGEVTGDARPTLKPVKASGLVPGDRLADGGEVLAVDRVAGKVFATVRNDDDRRRVLVFEPGADVERVAAGTGRAAEPVTVADAPAGQLAEGDRILVSRGDGALLPATVTGVSSDGDTRALDVRYGDGSTQTVLVDRGEMLPRLGGPEAGADDGPEPDPLEEPPVEAGPVNAGGIVAGDRFLLSSPDVYEALEVDTSGRDARIRVRRERDGFEVTFAFGKTQKIHRLGGATGGGGGPAPEPERATPEPLPDGTAAARPVLYTYQRRNLNWMGLDASDDATVRQAALRVRDRMPLSAEQAAALAQAVRARADAPDTKPVQQRSLGRLAHSLDAAAAQARGVPKPRKPEGRGTPFKAYAKNLAEGDHVALPVPRGRAKVGKVTGLRKVMGGRLVEVDVEYGDGRTETRLLTARTDTYVLPDLPDDVPVAPPGDRAELVMPAQIVVGDVLRRWDGAQLEVLEAARSSDLSARVRVKRLDPDPAFPEGVEYTTDIISADGGPAWVRIRRGAASADQPWELTIPDDDPNPPEVGAREVNLGDRVRVGEFSYEAQAGTVTDVKDLISNGAVGEAGTVVGKVIIIRSDYGGVNSFRIFDNRQSATIHRLAAADANTVERLRQEKLARERQAATAAISKILGDTATQAYQSVGSRGAIGAGSGERWVLSEIDQADIHTTRYGMSPVGLLITHLGITDPQTAEKMRERLDPIVRDIRERAREQVRESIRQAKPLPGEDMAAAHTRVLNQYVDSPPVDKDTFWSPASTLAELRAALAGSDTSAERILSHVPEVGHVGDLAARVDAYRAALGDGTAFGKVRVRRSVMAETTFDDLDAGRVPAVEEVEVGVPDEAADGGPGEAAMRHHDIIKAAGRDLDNDLWRRMSDAGVDALRSDLDEVRTVHEQPENSFNGIRDRLARERGYPDWDSLNTMATTGEREVRRKAYTDYSEVWDAARAQRNERQARIDDLTKRISDERRKAAMALLAEVRPDGLGGAAIDYYADASKTPNPMTTRSELVKAMRWAEASYPTRWIELVKERTARSGKRWSLGKVKRGYHNDWSKELRLSEGRIQTSDGGRFGDVSVHELGHAMEQAVPGLLAAQRAFLWSRTATGPVGSRTREKKTKIYANLDEWGYKDDFPEHYTGKDYVRGGKETAFEVFTTGIESLMAGSSYLDDDFRQWMLGVLALLGTPERTK
uniref:hypothetical protein n=1 Tax=Nonomuraea sp. CA-251285 TaxID=3240002 RepID=UPI003F493747